jgi:hypothetical protein
MRLPANGEDILDITFFTDEAWLHLSGYVNSQNSCVWSATNPHEIKDAPLHDQKVGVRGAISRNRIIGPLFFDDTVNSERYCEMILYPFIGHLNEDEIARGCFQQDGATAHTARVSMTLLRDVFGDKIISKDISSSRSPHLTPPDYYLWGEMKGAVYKDNPHTHLELWEAITNVIRSIPPIELLSVFANKIRRVDASLQARGAIPNICCNLSKYEKLICINVQGLSEHTHRLR